MDVITQAFTSLLQRYGCYENGKLSMKNLITAFGALFLLYESILSLIYRWENIDRRFAAVEDINLYQIVSLTRLYLLFYCKDIYSTLAVISRPIDLYGFSSSEKERVINEYSKIITQQWSFLYRLILMVQVNFLLLPCLQTCYNYYKKSEHFNTSDDIVLPYEFWHIGSSLTQFISVFLFEVVFTDVCMVVAKIIFLSLMCSVRRASLDVKLLMISVQEMNKSVEWSSANDREIKLKRYMNQIIKQHLHVCSQLSIYNKEFRCFAFCVLQALCLQICLLFYWLAEVDDTIGLQIKDGAQVSFLIVYTYAYSSLGQHITDQFEALRNTLYDCDWLDKPIWFKKSLVLMMTMASKTFEMKPFGLYAIGFKSFTSVMHAAYSYFNVLRTFKTT